MKTEKSSYPFSFWLLISTNLIPLFGSFFLDWSPVRVIVLYWFETLVIAFYSTLKLIITRSDLDIGQSHISYYMSKLYGMSMFVLFILLFNGVIGTIALTLIDTGIEEDVYVDEGYWSFIVSPLVNIMSKMIQAAPSGAIYWIIAIVISNGFSFFYNFLYKREHLDTSQGRIMAYPFINTVFVFLTLGLSIGMFNLTQSVIPFAIILIAGKTLIEAALLEYDSNKDANHKDFIMQAYILGKYKDKE